MKKQTPVLRMIAVCLCAALALSGCGSMSEWDATKAAMEKADSRGDTQRAVDLGQKYLSSAKSPESEIYGMMADYYQTLGDKTSQTEMLQKGFNATGDEDFYEEMIDLAGGLETLYPGLREGLYDLSQYELCGIAFDAMTAEKLDALFPVTEETYLSPEKDGGWYRSESYKNYQSYISWYPGSYYTSLNMDISLSSYSNRYDLEGPEITLPAGITMGNTRDTVMKKCGVPQEAIDSWKNFSYITLNDEGETLSSYFYTSEYADSSTCFSIGYDNRKVYGELRFDFSGSGKTLTGFNVVWHP